MMESYFESELIVEGSLEDHKIFDSEADLLRWIADLREEYARVGAVTVWEVYSTHHLHPYHGEECDCWQYVIDRSPIAKIGA